MKKMKYKYIVRRTVLKVLIFQAYIIFALGIFAYWLIH